MQWKYLHRSSGVLALLAAQCLCGQETQLGEAPTQDPVLISPKFTPPEARTQPSFAAADWYDTSNREAIRNAFQTVYAATNSVPLGYVGPSERWPGGDTSPAYKAAVLQRMNYFRAMAGVSSIPSLDSLMNEKSQLGALMIYTNGTLSHTPPTTWGQYTAAGAEALGNGNLCQGRQSDTGCVLGYMDDYGDNNPIVGHRRWILEPRVERIGTGDIPNGLTQLWNVTYINESGTINRQRPATRDEFVSWPPKGYVPYQLLFNRWSFHLPNADFTQANVTMTRNGVAVPLRVESRSEALNGYIYAPENAIVWIPDNLPTTPVVPVSPGPDRVYSVSVSGVKIKGVSRDFQYNVTVFDPANNGTTPQPSAPGQPNVVSFSPLSGSGYSGTFTGTFTQSSNNHYLGFLLFLPTPNIVQYTATGSCLIEYNKYSNGVRLIDNAGTGWLGPLEGVAIGPNAGTLANNQCSVNVANVVATVSGNTMTVTAPVTFFQWLGPVLSTFLQAEDSNGVWTGMTQFGNWVPPGSPQARLGPAVSGVTASATTGRQATYTIASSHTGGVGSLIMVNLLTSASIVGAPACHVVYFPGDNKLNIVNDAGTGLVSSTGVSPGQAGSLGNSRCSVNTALVSKSSTVNTNTLTLPVTYSAGFSGPKFVYVNVFDNVGLLTHWVTASTMLVQ
jgi:hypothetical protein